MEFSYEHFLFELPKTYTVNFLRPKFRQTVMDPAQTLVDDFVNFCKFNKSHVKVNLIGDFALLCNKLLENVSL
jgi:hypothetical protein